MDFPPGYAEADVSWQIVAVGSVFIALNSLFVGLRFLSKGLHRNPLGTDDWLIIPALVFCYGVCIIGIVEAKIAGVGRHFIPVLLSDPNKIVNYGKSSYAVEELYCVSVALPKISILASYLRIFTQQKAYRIITYIIGAIIIANAFAGVITSLASCHPFKARWQFTFPAGCIDLLPYWRWISMPNIITDVIMLLLPLPIVWHLQVPGPQKIALCGVFVLGGLGVVASIVRFAIFFDAKSINTDGTWVVAKLAIWSIIEPSIYLIAACLPSLRPLFLTTVSKVSTTVARTMRNTTRNSSQDSHILMESGLKSGNGITITHSGGFSRLDHSSEEVHIPREQRTYYSKVESNRGY